MIDALSVLAGQFAAELARVPGWALYAMANAAAVIGFAAFWIRELQPGFDPHGEPTGWRWVCGSVMHVAVLAVVLLLSFVIGAVLVLFIVGAEVGGALVARLRHARRVRALSSAAARARP